ncbi:MAG: rod shape-determining protein MreD [Flavobacteriaceae bacterium]|nr:rod shape-determining protein MreD [Flavobacteriaceae bacterium]
MDSKLILNIVRFFGLLLAQIILFNHIYFLGYLNPLVYLLYVAWFPVHHNRTQFILSSFALGMLLDISSDSMAINTAAILVVAYIRPAVLRFVFGVNYEFQSFKLYNTSFTQKSVYLFILILTHHLLIFSLEIFDFNQFGLILMKTIQTTLFTFVLAVLLSFLFSSRKK